MAVMDGILGKSNLNDAIATVLRLFPLVIAGQIFNVQMTVRLRRASSRES
jgi:hypothetical protein